MSASTVHTNPLDARVGSLEDSPRPGLAPLILIAEDDEDVRLMFKTLLELKGYRTAEAADGRAAVEQAAAVRPDLILVDLQLPRLNGFAVTRFVRQSDELRRVPIVIVSGHDRAKHLNLALAAGCNAFLEKPIDLDQLDGLLSNLLH